MQAAADMERRKDCARIARQKELKNTEIRTISLKKRPKSSDLERKMTDLTRGNGRKREKLAVFLRENRKNDTFSPEINPNSAELVKPFRNPNEKIEDRLLRLGKVLKTVKSAQERRENTEKPGKNSGKAVTERLMQYQQIYRDHKMMLRHQLAGSPTWTPEINAKSREITAGKTRNLSTPKQVRAPSLSSFPFKPTPNPASQLLAQRLPTSQSRLFSPRHTSPPPLTPQCTFHPATNPSKPSPTGLARWESLYSLNLRTLESRAKLRYEAQEREESLSQCTFRPAILTTSPRAVTGRPVVDRLLSWGETRRGKVKEAKDCYRKKDLEECTFSPTVTSTVDLHVYGLEK